MSIVNEIANELIEHSQNQSSKRYNNRCHPLENIGFLSKILFTWLTPLVKKSYKNSFDQKDHWKTYSKFHVCKNQIKFDDQSQTKKEGIVLVFKMFSYKFMIFFFCILNGILDFLDIVIIFFVTEYLTSTYNHPENNFSLKTFSIYLSLFIVIQVLKILNQGIVNHVVFNEILISRNCFTYSILEKSFKLPLGGMSKDSKGNITNLIQVDCNSLKDEAIEMPFLIFTLISCIGSFIMSFFLIGHSFLIFLGTSFVFTLISFGISKLEIKLENKILKLKDYRIQMLRNIFNNLKFIKFHVLENLFLKIVYDKREKEIRILKIIFVLFILIVFINWLCPNLSFLMTMTYLFSRNSLISVATLITFFKLYDFVSTFFRVLPYIFKMIFKFKLIDMRFKTFFNIENANLDFITYKEGERAIEKLDCQGPDPRDPFNDQESDIAIEIIDGHFDYEDIGLEKLESKKKTQKPKKQAKCQEAENKSNEEEAQSEGKPKSTASKFEIKNINLKIRSGEITFIIGKIGSGKTTLLYSIMGELVPKSENTKIKLSSKSIAYCPQTPFIQTKTIRDNITFYKPEDKVELLNSVRLACLEDDLMIMPMGVDTMLAENGENISGGQRTRVNLARCFYQDSDIYLLDDPLSSLDHHVADEIMDKAIKRELEGKTRVIVTHSVQHLSYADKIIYMDDGEIKFDGDFTQFKKTEYFEVIKEAFKKQQKMKIKEIKNEVKSKKSVVSRKASSIFQIKSKEHMEKISGREFEIYEELSMNLMETKNSPNNYVSVNNFQFSRSKRKKSIYSDIINKKLKTTKKRRNAKEYIHQMNKKNKMKLINQFQNYNESVNNCESKELMKNDDFTTIPEKSKMDETNSMKSDGKESKKQEQNEDIQNTFKKENMKGLENQSNETESNDINHEPDFGIDCEKEKIIKKYFIDVNNKKGRQLWSTVKLFLKYTNGIIFFLFLLGLCVLITFANYICMNIVYDFIQNFSKPDFSLRRELLVLYIYFLVPVSLVVIRTGLISYCSIKTSRLIHHEMMFSCLYGDLLGFHDRIETAKLINTFSLDVQKIDSVIIYYVSGFMIYLGFLISDIIIAVTTVNGWILIPFLIYYSLMFYYQNMYVRLKKDLNRLNLKSRTPILNLTNEILKGKMVFKSMNKEIDALDEMSLHLENNSKNLTTENALTQWFSIRVSIFNVLIVQACCFGSIVFLMYMNLITIKKVIIFFPFCLSYIFNISNFIDIMSLLEMFLVSLERSSVFASIPCEKNYLNIKCIEEEMSIKNIHKGKVSDYRRPFQINIQNLYTPEESNSKKFNSDLYEGNTRFISRN